jgi:RNA polymerase sigma-70 factor, ECF subfamily
MRSSSAVEGLKTSLPPSYYIAQEPLRRAQWNVVYWLPIELPGIMPGDHEITELLERWGAGDQQALDRLMPCIYDELKRVAGGYLRGERPGHTLQPTALVHEAYLRMVHLNSPKIENRKHFLVLAAQAMRRVLVDHARRHNAGKRDAQLMPPDSGLVIQPKLDFDVVALDDALNRLAELDPEKGRIVELRYFAGLSVGETADVVGRSPATVKREWAVAKAWLYRQLNGEGPNDSPSMG